MSTAKDKFIPNKIKKISTEGIRGKKVSQKQKITIAISMEKRR